MTRADVDKGDALRRLCVTRGIAPDDVAAMGDGRNDLGMLAFAGVAVAPANAHPEVLADGGPDHGQQRRGRRRRGACPAGALSG